MSVLSTMRPGPPAGVVGSSSSPDVLGPKSIDASRFELTRKQTSYYQQLGEDVWEHCAKRVVKKEIPGRAVKEYNRLIKRLNGGQAMGAVPDGANLPINVCENGVALHVDLSLKAKWNVVLGLWIEEVGEVYALKHYYRPLALPFIQAWGHPAHSPVESVLSAYSVPGQHKANPSPRMEVEILSRAERTLSGAISMVRHRVLSAATSNAVTPASPLSPISVNEPLPAGVLSLLPRASTPLMLPHAPALSALVSLGSPATQVGHDISHTLAKGHLYGPHGAKRALPDEFVSLVGGSRASKIPRSYAENCDALAIDGDGRTRSRTAPAALASQPVYFYMPPSLGTNIYDYSPEHRDVDRELAIAQLPFLPLGTELHSTLDDATGFDVGMIAYSMEEAARLRAAMHEPAVGFSVSEDGSTGAMAAQGLSWFSNTTEDGGEEVGSLQSVLEAHPACVDPRSHDLNGV